MIARLAAAAGAALVVGVLMTGCSAPAEPAEPTPLFTSEEQAFAAAEETYRAYVEALNNVDLSDPATFEDVYAWTTGEANSIDRKTLSRYHADGWIVDGPTMATLVQPIGGSEWQTAVQLAVCLDVSNVTLVDSDGVSMVGQDRPDVQSMSVTVVPTDEGMRISLIEGREGEPNCAPD